MGRNFARVGVLVVLSVVGGAAAFIGCGHSPTDYDDDFFIPTPTPTPTPSPCEIACWACSGTNKYAAIALSKSTGACGWSANYGNRSNAEARAVQECDEETAATDCATVIWVYNQCAALAANNRGYGWSSGATRASAENSAIAQCESVSVRRPGVQ